MNSDRELLCRYAEAHCEDAFAELVRRYVNVVYSAALRQVNGNAPLAQDVAQSVFTDLARKAGTLSRHPSLSGWLYTSAHFAATKAVRSESRRRAHEQEAQAKTIAMATLQKTLIAGTLAVLAGAGLYEAQQAWRLGEQVQTLQQKQAVLTEQLERVSSENQGLSSQLAQAGRSPSVSSERLRELLRLRGEVGVLRRQQRELEQTLAAGKSQVPQNAAPAATVPSQRSASAPFQVQLVADGPGEDTEPLTNNASGAAGNTFHVNKTPLLDYTAIRSANVTKNAASGESEINIELSDEGKELFAAVTKENLNKRLAIVLNGQLYAAPVIRSEITEGKAQITGNFTEEEAQQLAAKINEAIRYQ